jgi:hypothetical protein
MYFSSILTKKSASMAKESPHLRRNVRRSLEQTECPRHHSITTAEQQNLFQIDEVLQATDQPEFDARLIGYRPALRRIVKTGDQAACLCQLLYWYRVARDGKRRLRVLRGGKCWVAKSYEDLGVEIGLTERQSRQTVDALVRLKLIERKQMKFAERKICHFRLLGAELQTRLSRGFQNG